jgi:hypothetical protein
MGILPGRTENTRSSSSSSSSRLHRVEVECKTNQSFQGLECVRKHAVVEFRWWWWSQPLFFTANTGNHKKRKAEREERGEEQREAQEEKKKGVSFYSFY